MVGSQHVENAIEIALSKAKEINKSPSCYGTFAEIGAGQEVARFFFQAGGASATVAKTMSAYDMEFSDAIYGSEKSYVCISRVFKMLDHEYELLERRLSNKKESRRFFVYANSVATGSKRRKTHGHGWAGVRFQRHPEEQPSEVFIHLRMLAENINDQQTFVGVAGVNLLHACLHHYDDPAEIISALGEGLRLEDFEIDSVRFSGPAFEKVDNRVMQIDLVRKGLTSAVMYNHDGEISSPSELLFRKHAVAIRGSFRPVTNVKIDMLEQGLKHFKQKTGVSGEDIRVICEITTEELYVGGDVVGEDFLARVDMLASLGYAVMVSNHKDDFSLVHLMRRYSTLSRSLILGSHNLHKILDKRNYRHLVGGLLEALGLMLNGGTHLYLYPINTEDGPLTIEKLDLSPENRILVNYLLEAGLVEQLDTASELEYVSPSEVVHAIQNKEDVSHLIPEKVYSIIKHRNIYGV